MKWAGAAIVLVAYGYWRWLTRPWPTERHIQMAHEYHPSRMLR